MDTPIIMKYPKINTIWKRDENNKFRIIEGDYSKIEFAAIKKWNITEKIDGTNIRVIYKNGIVSFGGRTDNAQIPAHLYEYLQRTFTLLIMHEMFGDTDVVLFGEGYGPKIQKGGGLYRKDVGFILFDAYIGGWWVLRDSIEDISDKIGISYVPLVGTMEINEAVEYVQSKPNSLIANEPKIMEGIVARSTPLLLFRDGNPLMWKLKVRDYKDA
ncbi:MAG: RNA ligase family protein [Methanosarcinales archaeon]|nr:RNA ligase family protein [Methanosarcinales archaeon]